MRRDEDPCELPERKYINERMESFRTSDCQRGLSLLLRKRSSWKTRGNVRINERRERKRTRSKRRVPGLCLGTKSAFDTSEMGNFASAWTSEFDSRDTGYCGKRLKYPRIISYVTRMEKTFRIAAIFFPLDHLYKKFYNILIIWFFLSFSVIPLLF